MLSDVEHARSDNFTLAKNFTTSENSSVIIVAKASINDPKEVWNVIPCRIRYHKYRCFRCNLRASKICKHFIRVLKKSPTRFMYSRHCQESTCDCTLILENVTTGFDRNNDLNV